jgi:hypothetical protein
MLSSHLQQVRRLEEGGRRGQDRGRGPEGGRGGRKDREERGGMKKEI